jgi:hypothetical protein
MDKLEKQVNVLDLYLMLQYWLNVFWKRKYVLLVFFISGSAVTYLYHNTKPPVYNAKLSFSLEQKGGSLGIAGLASQLGLNIGGSSDGLSGNNLLRVMKSRRVIEDVLSTKIYADGDSTAMLDRFIDTHPRLREKILNAGLYPLKSRANVNEKDSVIGIIYEEIVNECLEIERLDKEQSLVIISCTAHDDIFSKNFVTVLASKSIDFYLEATSFGAKENVRKLELRVDSVEMELEDALRDLANRQDAQFFAVENSSKILSVESQIRVSMLTTLYGELIKNLELSKVLTSRHEQVFTIIDFPHYPFLVRIPVLRNTFLGGIASSILIAVMIILHKFYLRIKGFHAE